MSKQQYPKSEDQCSNCKAHAMVDVTVTVEMGTAKVRYCRRCKRIALHD